MGEEEKKPEAPAEEKKQQQPEAEAKKPEGTKKEDAIADGGSEEKKDGGGEAAPPPPPPPPEEVVMQVYMHCEGCARKVKRCLKGFDGVEAVTTDCRTHKVVVKGRKAAEDPMKVVERVQKKSGRKVELLSPMPPPKPEPKPEEVKAEEVKPAPEEKKVEPPVVITVVMKVHMHCEACAQEIKKRILKMKGVETAEPDLKASEVTVKGVFEAAKLVEYVYKRTGKHALVVKQDPPEPKPETEAADKAKEEGKAAEEEKGKAEGEKKAEGEGGGAGEDKDKKDVASPEELAAAAAVAAAGVKPEVMRRNELLYYYPRMVEYNAYPPQIFSDENPNACSVM